MRLDPLGDFGLDGLGQHPLSPVAKNLGQHVLAASGWQAKRSEWYSLAWWRTPGECGR